MAGGEFVDGWLVAQVLGEGAYGEVRLLVHAASGACVALKAVRADEAGAGEAREAALHRALRHPHVLRCMGARRHGALHYLFLEYAQGGELFDRIEPDRGMPAERARRYWRQLLAGLRYLHARGVAHRDLKPENLLLDCRDRLKISDFGMATLFRVGGRERLLARVCGTLPYAAPEVLAAPRRPYRAPPADVWSAALVLLAMLAGELPWERAGAEDARFAAWSAQCEGGAGGAGGAAAGGPWRKAGGALALLRRALRPDAARRATLAELLDEPWLARAPDGVAIFPQHSLTILLSDSEPREEESRGVVAAASEAEAEAEAEGARRSWSSQPAARGGEDGADGALSAAAMDAMLSSSQPAHADDLLLATPALSPSPSPSPSPHHQGTAGGALARLVRRMTRVWLRVDAGAALAALAAVCDEQRAPWRRVTPNVLAIECGGDVCMRAWALPVAGGAGGADGARSLVEFRRSRGCGLAFKRRYVRLRDALLAAAPPAPPPPGLERAAPAEGEGAPMDL